MNDHFQSTNRDHHDPKLSLEGEKISWQRPDMVYLGRLTDLVQGGPGKSVGLFDSDPNGNQLPKPK